MKQNMTLRTDLEYLVLFVVYFSMDPDLSCGFIDAQYSYWVFISTLTMKFKTLPELFHNS